MKNKSFKTPKKFDIVMSAQMPVRFGKTSRMLNNLLQNCDSCHNSRIVTVQSFMILHPADYQKIGR